VPNRPNVILIVLDTARRDRFGTYGYQRRTTPTVDSLAEEGMRAERMVANAPYTVPSHASLFSGLYPTEHGCHWKSGHQLRPSVRLMMAEWFRSLGYETVCATNNNLISNRTGLARGFDKYAARLQLERGWPRRIRRARKALLGADSGGRITNRWLDQTLPDVKKPMFLFVNYLECHWSYAPPPSMVRRVDGPRFLPFEGLHYRTQVARKVGPWEAMARADERRLGIYSALYDAELATVDGHLAHLLKTLRSTGHMNEGETVLMVTSDHGEHIGEHGLADHHASLGGRLIDLPFVAWGPGIIPSGTVPGTYELVDVLPSLAALLGEELPVGYLKERRSSLFSPSRGAESDYAFSEWPSWHDWELKRLAGRNPSYDFKGLGRDLVSVRDETHKLVRSADGTQELFNLVDDWHEDVDISSEHPEIVSRLSAVLDARIAAWRVWEEDEHDPLSAEDKADIEKQLSALGYI
jgi:arylsulfatase A-like enzyme